MNSSTTPPFIIDRLTREADSWSDVISAFENLIAEIDNRSARAVRMFPRLGTSALGNELADEEGGFHADLNSIVHGYAIAKNDSSVPDPRLELDYPDFPALIRIWDVFQKGDDNLSSVMSSLFSERRMSLEALELRRSVESPPRPLCPCCEKNARERARYASMHPLFDILMQATQRKDQLQIRVLSPFADLAVPLLPYRVEADHGVITAIDKDHTSAFHVDVKWLHAMRIKPVKLDGSAYAMLIGYDSYGTEIFHVSSPNASDVDDWTGCCEWSKQFFSG